MELSLPTLAVTGMLTHTALAGGLIEQLPADGSWVRFDMIPSDSHFGSKPAPEPEVLTVSSVGVVTVDGEKCRWIELKIVPKAHEDMPRFVKYLVPEQYLTAKEDPMSHVLKLGQMDGVRFGPTNTVVEAVWSDKPDFRKVPYHMFLCGPLTKVVTLPNVSVETNLGKLDCSVVTGRYEYDGNDILAFRGTFENQLHKKAPFGVVAMRVMIETMQDGLSYEHTTWSLSWIDTGTNAKSEVPNPP